jgi:hypothetical protein
LLSLRAWAKDWLFLPGLVQESVLPGSGWALAWAVESGSAWVVESVSTWVAELRWALAVELGSAWAVELGSAWAWPVLAERD